MSTCKPTEFSSDELAIDQLPADAAKLGVDGDGDVHYFSRQATAVYVFDGAGELIYSRDDIEAGDPLDGWMTHISDVRGWDSINLYGSFIEAFASQLEEI